MFCTDAFTRSAPQILSDAGSQQRFSDGVPVQILQQIAAVLLLLHSPPPVAIAAEKFSGKMVNVTAGDTIKVLRDGNR